MGSFFFVAGSCGSGRKVASKMECVIMDAMRPFLFLPWVSSFYFCSLFTSSHSLL
jgi:hypothetical protein